MAPMEFDRDFNEVGGCGLVRLPSRNWPNQCIDGNTQESEVNQRFHATSGPSRRCMLLYTSAEDKVNDKVDERSCAQISLPWPQRGAEGAHAARLPKGFRGRNARGRRCA